MMPQSKVEVFKEQGGRFTFSHFYQHYGHKALQYFSKHTKVTYDDSKNLTGISLGSCTYNGHFEEVRLRDKTWNGGTKNSKDVTVAHEFTHSLYSQISGSQAWKNSSGQRTYAPLTAVNEGLAVLGPNLTSFAPHCSEYMQHACRTLSALEVVAKEEGTTPKKLYLSLSNISDMPLEHRKGIKVRLDTLYSTKYIIKNYTGKEIVDSMKQWRESE
jgi:hypothetical protein